MSSLHWFLIAVVVIAALGYWNWQRTQDQMQQLQASGFIISDDLGGVPRLLVDRQSQSIAVVAAQAYRRYPFTAIASTDYNVDSGPEVETDFRIEISLHQQARALEKIIYADEWRAQEQLKKLQHYLSQAD